MKAYVVDVGVLIAPDAEGGQYSSVYDKQHGYFDEDQYYCASKEQAIQEALDYVKDGVEGTYGVVSATVLPDSVDISDCYVAGETYDLNSVVFSAKKENGAVVKDFVGKAVLSVAEQLKDAVAIEYKGVMFDEWTVDEETVGVWGEMCQCCADKYKDVLSEELSDGGVGSCSVKGCSVVGADSDNERHYYVDFKPELIKPLSKEQLQDRSPEREGLEEQIKSAEGLVAQCKGSDVPERDDR